MGLLDTDLEISAVLEHLESASLKGADPGVSFEAHFESRFLLGLVR
jgi:hypothetical protein